MTADAPTRVALTDVTLRDGSHAMGHRISREQVVATVTALERAGISTIEVGHGDGLGGSSFNYGFSMAPEMDLIRAATETATRASISCVVLPGVGTVELMKEAADLGARTLRVATHSTEADIAIQHLELARDLGLDAVGFLMLSHMTEPGELARQATIMAEAGAGCVYLADSAGAMLPGDAAARVSALRESLDPEVEVGFHAHNNLSLAIACSVAAIEAGASRVDGALAGLGAGAGNAATEVLAAVLDRVGIVTGIDVIAALEAAENAVRPWMDYEPRLDMGSVVLGYGGVYSSFLLHARRAAERYDVPMHEILLEAGRRSLVGGQEDVLIEIAVGLSRAG